MSQSGSKPLVEFDDVSKIIEMAVEPSYISEIARKMREADHIWQNMSHETAVETVSRIVYVLKEDGRVETHSPDYASFGGQKKSSPKTAIAGDLDNWNEYTVVYAPSVDPDNVRRQYLPYVDDSISVDEKLALADNLSSQGNIMAQQSENILADQLRHIIESYDVFEVTDYNKPGPDVYVQGFTTTDGDSFDYGMAIEISTRWVNPIGEPYISKKLDASMGYESDHGAAVDLLIMAPRYRQKSVQKHFSSDMVSLRRLPMEGGGNPVIVPDSMGEQVDYMDTGEYGINYPLISAENVEFQDNLETVLRSFNAVTESQYRDEITEIVQSRV